MSGVLGMPYFITEYTGFEYNYATGNPVNMDPKDFGLPSWEKSLMTSILSAGTFTGALIAGDVADFIGRRMTIILGCLVFAVGCVLEIAATNQVGLFVIGRLVAGGGIGFISAIIILYMSEIAPRKVRGALVSSYQFCITVGIVLANCVTYATQHRPDTGSYRIPIGVQFLWAIVLAVGLFLLRKCLMSTVWSASSDGPASRIPAILRQEGPTRGGGPGLGQHPWSAHRLGLHQGRACRDRGEP